MKKSITVLLILLFLLASSCSEEARYHRHRNAPRTRIKMVAKGHPYKGRYRMGRRFIKVSSKRNSYWHGKINNNDQGRRMRMGIGMKRGINR